MILHVLDQDRAGITGRKEAPEACVLSHNVMRKESGDNITYFSSGSPCS